MNQKLYEFEQNIKNKKIGVLGLGISNIPLIRFLHKLGAEDITGFDRASKQDLEETITELDEEGVKLKYYLGDGYLEHLSEGFDIIFKTPVVRADIPQLQNLEGTTITSEMEEFLKLCPAKVYGITGSDGKTTTTTLIYKMLESQGYKCWIGGNIGTPLLEQLSEIQPEDKVVVELSSFQLMNIGISTNVSVVTNVTPNHLDVHKSMEEYTSAKTEIFKHQKPGDVVVLNLDNEVTKGFRTIAEQKVILFSRKLVPKDGIGLENGWIIQNKNNEDIKILKVDDILLPGLHNIENYMAAIAAISDVVEIIDIQTVAKTFGGVEHRLELVRELNGVKYYNSAIDSSPNRTKAALSVFKNKVILIAGGKDKNIPYDDLGEDLVDKVKIMILTGPTADKIEKAAKDECLKREINFNIKVYKVKSYEEAVNIAFNEAKSEDVVLLSPASTSFDMFKNFMERGKKFKELVDNL